MGTHDEETRKYFQDTGVTCQLFVRAGLNEQTSILNRNTTDRIFTHHQKTVRPVAGIAQMPFRDQGSRLDSPNPDVRWDRFNLDPGASYRIAR